MFSLAREYGLALRVREKPIIEKVQSQRLPCIDYDFLDSYGLDTADKSARYAQLLHDLPVGLSEWAVHPGLDNAELRAIDSPGAPIRQTDYNFLMSHQAREIIQDVGIIQLSYLPLQALWKSQSQVS